MSSDNTPSSHFSFVHSCDLNLNLQVKICTLEDPDALSSVKYEDLLENPLLRFSGRKQSRCPDLMVEVYVASGAAGTPLHIPVFTSYKHFTLR